MIDVTNRKTLHDPWQDEDKSTLLSPHKDKHWEQIVWFPDCKDNDYAIEFDLTLRDGQTFDNKLWKDAGVILRYSRPGHYYYAGVGGFGARTFIAVVDDTKFRCLASQHVEDEVEFNQTYHLRVECRGANISLYEKDRKLLSVDVQDYVEGCWGLRTVRTQAQFAHISQKGPSTQKAFVIMPFTASLSFVYDVMKGAIEGNLPMKCLRVDEGHTSAPITEEVKQCIRNADLVIADLTGQNPNVYYEAGFAHALGKKMILIAQSEKDLAFHMRPIRTLFYTKPNDLRETLIDAIKDTLAGSD